MKRLHVFVMLMIACFWVLSGSVQAQQTFCIGNLVWNDLNKNGVQDPGEPGLPDITVSLLKLLGTDPGTISTSDLLSACEYFKTTKTDLNGNYSFGNLPAGNYVIMVGDILGKELKGWAASPMLQGTSDEKDSDIFPYLFFTPVIELEPLGQTPNDRLGIDAGLFEIKDCDLVTIGDMVFNDCNHNGIMDCDEKGIAGVIVKLFSCDVRPQNGVASIYSPSAVPQFDCGLKVQQTVTDLNGHYEFDKVLPGQYCVEVCLPEGFKVIPRPGCPDVCNPVIPSNHTGCMLFTACTKNMDIDFAVCHNNCDLASIGDLVWLDDSNKDGIQNMGETGFPGVKVILYRYCCNETPSGAVSATGCDPIEVASLTTDANGKYLFSNLLPGYYQIEVKAPFGYSASPMDQNVDASGPNQQELTYDSDIYPETFKTKWIALWGENKDIDAGLYFDCRLVAAIQGHVWKDADEDGVPDEREALMPGVTLKLYTCGSSDCGKDPCGDKLVATTKTDKNGYYKFVKLDPANKYCVTIELPSCYLLTKQVPVMITAPTAAVEDYYSDFDPSTKHTACVKPTAGCNVFTVFDAGLIYSEPVPGTIGDFVWEDANKNGIQDCGEKGIPGVTVELHKCDGGALVKCTTTDAEGKYLFTNVPANETYYVKFVLPGAFQFTAQNAGNDDAVDSDPCPEKGITANFTLGDAQSTLLIDAGMFRATCTVSDIVYVDKNYNGKMDAEESGMGGVDVELFACGDESMVQSVKTDATGRYTFNNVLGGSYYLKINIPAGYVLGTLDDNAANANFVVSQTSCFDVTKEGVDMKIPLVTSVESRTGIPTAFEMDQNFPNPFNPSTTIRFGIPEAGMYTLKVYNMLGQEVATLLNGELSAGYKDVVFDASRLTSGVYIYRLTGTNVVITKKMMLNK